ncbi:MAG: metallophosphoesterase [Lachnospiraceae bacterium]|nr:metallophosphoesterase [Lachnospiraceae bacterium]
MRITEYDIDASFPVKTAAVAADLHDREAPEVREALLSLRPDFILIPGDLTSRCYTEETHIGRKYTKPYKPPLEALDFLNFSSKLAPTYYSPGNHEWWRTTDDIRIITETGVCFLDRSFVRFGDFLIGGLPSAYGWGLTYEKHAVPELSWLQVFEEEKGFHLLLSHNPEYWPKYLHNRKIELTVSGHAHGGQWRIFGRGIYAPGQGVFPKYTRGMYGDGRLVISAGLTNTQPLVPRIGNPTELLVLRIGTKQEK